MIVWKHPYEDFNVGSSLHVSESEEALFYKDGIIEKTFTAGKYTLQTENYPFVSRLLNQISGGISSFNCKVYYVHKEHTLELKWGTDSPIQVLDPIYEISTRIVARGSYSIQIADSKKFFVKFYGSSTDIMDATWLSSKFKSAFSQVIKSTIARYILESNREILGICAAQDVLAEAIKPKISEIMDEYGVRLVNFYINALDIPHDDPGRIALESARAEKVQLDKLGDNWTRVQSRNILSDLANNPGSAGDVASIGAGLGMGLAGGSAFAGMSQKMFEPSPANSQSAPQESKATCPKCNCSNPPGMKFCGNCGTEMSFVIQCPNCGLEIPPGFKFCGKCGSKVGE